MCIRFANFGDIRLPHVNAKSYETHIDRILVIGFSSILQPFDGFLA